MFGDYGIKLKANEIENYEFDYWYVNRITSNGNTLVKRTTKEFSYELTSDIKSVEITAFYKEKEILSIDLLETKDNFTLKQFKDRVLVNYLNSKATSMELSLYNLEGVLLSKSEILDKNKEFSVIMNYPDSNEKMFILKCKTDFGIYSFKLLK